MAKSSPLHKRMVQEYNRNVKRLDTYEEAVAKLFESGGEASSFLLESVGHYRSEVAKSRAAMLETAPADGGDDEVADAVEAGDGLVASGQAVDVDPLEEIEDVPQAAQG